MVSMMLYQKMKNKGFTLVEILVALAVIAIAMAALIRASGNHTYSASYLKQKTLAHYVAMNEIARLQITKQWPDVGKKEDSTEMASKEWFWIREISKTADDNTRQVKITVYENDDRDNNLARAIAYLSLAQTATDNSQGAGQP